MKKIVFVFALLTFVSASVISASLWFKINFAPISDKENYQDFLVTKGQGASSVANSLESQGFIKSALAFKLYSQLTGITGKIQSGEYRISPHMNLSQIASELTSPPREVWVTIPEGLRREEIVEKFIEGLSKKEEEKEMFRAEFLENSKDLEGRLFPDTYLFPREVKAAVVVNKMKTVFDKKIEDFKEDIENSDLSLNQITTLASILERETITNEERPIVAGILLNRFEIGMPLQADATVQYAVGNVKCKSANANCDWWPRPLTRDDLTIDSKFNTYKYNGFPPSPISNPGLSSLKAAINPAETEFFYYIHDPSGKIHYAKSLEDHNANVRRYLRK